MGIYIMTDQELYEEAEFNSIEEAIEDFKQGKMLIVVDDPQRENEGDIVQAGEFVTAESVNFVASKARGLICAAIDEGSAKHFELQAMVGQNSALQHTGFTVSVDAVEGTTTGISAYDRARTFKVLSNNKADPRELGRPGHIFPVVAKPGGVLRRTGHTEASVDLCRLANCKPVAMMCEIMAEDGTMMRLAGLMNYAKEHQIMIITIADLIRYRREHESFIEKEASVRFPNEFGEFQLTMYRDLIDNKEHIAITMGEFTAEEPVLLRVHSECITGDVFHSARCDCGAQKDAALKMIAKEGKGALIYLRQEGRGIGLKHKLMAYELQDKGFDTVEANIELGFKPDLRDYGIGAQIIKDLGIRKMKLMTNNPKKIVGLVGYDLDVVERIPIEIKPNKINKFYLETKRDKMGHMILEEEDKKV